MFLATILYKYHDANQQEPSSTIRQQFIIYRKSLKIILIKNIFFLHHFMHIYKGDGIEIVQGNNLVISTHAIY